MACGLSILSGNGWAAILTWIAFAVAATFFVTLLYARRREAREAAPGPLRDEISRLAERIEDISRRLESVERDRRPD